MNMEPIVRSIRSEKTGRKPLVVCPTCQPEPLWYCGPIIVIECKSCRELKEAAREERKW